MKKAKGKRWEEMNARQLAAATAEFEGSVIDRTRAMDAGERGKWRAAKRRGRPRVGKGAKAVSVTIEAGLLERADRMAKRLGLTRAQLIARGLEGVLRAG
jgi:hypothetical protein